LQSLQTLRHDIPVFQECPELRVSCSVFVYVASAAASGLPCCYAKFTECVDDAIAQCGYATKVCEDPSLCRWSRDGSMCSEQWAHRCHSPRVFGAFPCAASSEKRRTRRARSGSSACKASVEVAIWVECGCKVGGVPPQNFAKRLVIFLLTFVFDADSDDVIVIVT